jgi:Kef-type K+ transport system membrane component KefB
MLDLTTLILQVAVIIGVSRGIALLFHKMQQPKVIGEMFAGIMLGPSLLGWMAPKLSASLFPPSSLGYLNALSQVGVVIYMFLVGLALKPKELREHRHAAILTSHVSIIVPFVLGATLALFLYPRLCDDRVSFTSFALFVGAAMSITAFPVLARILTDRKMLGSSLGTMAIACAAVDDVTGWCILAYIVILVRARQEVSIPLWLTLVGLGLFLSVMLFGVKRMLRAFEKVFKREGQLSENLIALMVVVLLASALTTEKLGLHLLFGSFLAGAIMPKEQKFVRHVLSKFESVTVVLLLPLFFAFTGLRTSIRLIHGGEMWLYCLAIIVVAIVGKLGGSMIAARTAGSPWRDAAGLGILMNTRGLMELVILNIGLDIGILTPALFSMFVLMALVTTFMTTPLLERVYPVHLIQKEVLKASEREIAYEPA